MKDLVEIQNDEPVTTSLLIAEKFGKRHGNIIRKIEGLDSDVFTRLKIALSEYIDESGKSNKIYLLNRDAFAFLAMGFIGAEANRWKLDYIEAFNRLEGFAKRQLRKTARQVDAIARRQAIVSGEAMKATIKAVRAEQGKETQPHHYVNESLLINYAMTGRFQTIDKHTLDDRELSALNQLQQRNAVMYAMGWDRERRKRELVELGRKMQTCSFSLGFAGRVDE